MCGDEQNNFLLLTSDTTDNDDDSGKRKKVNAKNQTELIDTQQTRDFFSQWMKWKWEKRWSGETGTGRE